MRHIGRAFFAGGGSVRTGDSDARPSVENRLSGTARRPGFFRNEDGAVTVEYVVVVFGAVALSLAIVASVSGGVWSLSRDIGDGMQDANFDLSGSASGSGDSGDGGSDGGGSGDSGAGDSGNGNGDDNGGDNGDACTGNCGVGKGKGGGNGTENEGKGKGHGKSDGKYNY